MHYLTEAGVKFLNEWDDTGGKFDRKTSPLTPQKHSMGGRVGPIEFVKNAMAIRRKIKASPKGSDVHYAREGGVKTNLERLTKLYSRIKGRKFTAGSLEHHDTDPYGKDPHNKAYRDSVKKHGRKATKQGKEDTWPGSVKRDKPIRKGVVSKIRGYFQDKKARKEGEKRAWGTTDHGAKTPHKSELVQRDMNQDRRKGHYKTVTKHEKQGKVVVGTVGAGHMKDEDK